MFSDVNRSTEYLVEFQEQFMFSEIKDDVMEE